MAKIVGTEHSDNIVGSDENDRIWSLAGNDFVEGGLGNDIIDGGAGDDVLTTGAGAASGFDELTGGAGNDRLIFNVVGGAARGGDGTDTLVVDLSNQTDAVVFNSPQGHAYWGDPTVSDAHLYFTDLERLNLQTGAGGDTIDASGFAFANIRAGDGDDQVLAGNGNDQISGGAGQDQILGGDGEDQIRGGRGSDIIDGGNGDDDVSGDEGNDTLLGGGGNDSFSAGVQDSYYAGYWFRMSGGDGDDTFSIYSDGSFGSVDGGEGVDTLSVNFVTMLLPVSPSTQLPTPPSKSSISMFVQRPGAPRYSAGMAMIASPVRRRFVKALVVTTPMTVAEAMIIFMALAVPTVSLEERVMMN